jgi:hypothetical protein
MHLMEDLNEIKKDLPPIERKDIVSEIADNKVAIEIAKQKYNELGQQKKFANKISDVVARKSNADIDSASIKVESQEKDNKVARAKIRNELIKLRADKKYIRREQKHRLEMQRKEHIEDKYKDLLMRTCRKRQKDENGKWQYMDEYNVPSSIKLGILLFFDTIISTLNAVALVFGALNKTVLKGLFIILLVLFLFVQPFREMMLGLIGITI